MKQKNLIGIAVLVCLLLIPTITVGQGLFFPKPAYTISSVYDTVIGENTLICFKIEGYEGTHPCFNESEFTDLRDAQSLQNLHNRMVQIDEANAINIERKTISRMNCTLDIDCAGAKIAQEYVCEPTKVGYSNTCQRVNRDTKEWIDSIKDSTGVRL